MGCELLGSGHEADRIPPSPVLGAQPSGWDQVGVSLQGHLWNAVEGQVSDELSGAGPGGGEVPGEARYLQCHLAHKDGCEDVVGHSEEDAFLKEPGDAVDRSYE